MATAPNDSRALQSHVRSSPRWTLSRAGIINVYQYGEEILEFGGGRLLLRGVNGSGKSTAMNMLLPFLLDGEVRRIDAAGEQSGVLQAWMLSGRDESIAQPVGYLWLEVEKAGEYLSFGCGIRASRSTETVTTWWFITSRRPGIDLQLVEGKVPISSNALKALISPEPVFAHDQRGEYRGELSRRLFGGATTAMEEHLHLLRLVRNPRVGDRIDTELPQHLQNALPRLSEGAIEDAAQPLEDLEDHRRNVAQLRATATTLEAIHEVYRAYARTELHRHARLTSDAVDACRKASRDEDDARKTHAEAQARKEEGTERKQILETQLTTLQSRIAALKDSDAYKSGAALNDLRNQVGSLKRGLEQTEGDYQRSQKTTHRAAEQLRGAHAEAQRAHHDLGQLLCDLGMAASHCRVSERPPGIPSFTLHPDSAPDLPLAPPLPLDLSAPGQGISQLHAATQERVLEVATVEEAVKRIGPAEQDLRNAETVVEHATRAHQSAITTLQGAREAFQGSVQQWQSAVTAWLERLQQHHSTHDLPVIERPTFVDKVVDELLDNRQVTPRLSALMDPALEHHRTRRADTQSSLKRQAEVVSDCESQVAELAAKQLSDPPRLPWQQRSAPCLSELVDFQDNLDPGTRARLEAALESSGLLSAQVEIDGTLRLSSGQLLLAATDQRAGAPLALLLKPDLPESVPEALRKSLERILAGISTDLSSDADTVINAEGEFRVGKLRGRWSKPAAEHIGVSARRAALERQRMEAARLLAEAQAEHSRLETLLQAIQAALNEAQTLRRELPSEQAMHNRLWQRTTAEAALEDARNYLEDCRERLLLATQKYSEAVNYAQATAQRLLLPASLPELSVVREELQKLLAGCATVRRELPLLKQAIDRWKYRGEEWHSARDAESQMQSRLEDARRELLNTQERLETLEASIGAAYEQILAEIQSHDRRHRETRESLRTCEQALEKAAQEVGVTAVKWQGAVEHKAAVEAACLHTLGVLRQVLDTEGLIEAAIDPVPDPSAPGSSPVAVTFPVVENSVAGARKLAESLRSQIPEPGVPTPAESVRRSIKQRRDQIGNGWDAEDRQPNPDLPLTVMVTSADDKSDALAASVRTVRAQLNHMESLLTQQQLQALRNLLQGLVAREVAEKMHAAELLIARMNRRLEAVTTSHGIGVRLEWKQLDNLDPTLAPTIALLAKTPDLRTAEEDQRLAQALGARIAESRLEKPDTPYRDLIAHVLDYREWHEMRIFVQRPGHKPERLSRKTALSEGEKKMVTYLPMFAAVAASCDSLAIQSPDVLRFLLLDDAFNKVSEDNHPKLLGLLVELDLDFIVTSERLWGTYGTVPQLAITEVLRDANSQTILLEHFRWNGRDLEMVA